MVNHRKPTIHGIFSALVNTNKQCLSNYSLLKVKRNGGIVDLEICYDELSLKTIYVKFEIDGVSLKKFVTVIIPPVATQNINLYPENIACFYTKVMQKKFFKFFYLTLTILFLKIKLDVANTFQIKKKYLFFILICKNR